MTQSEELIQNRNKVIKTAQRLFLDEGIASVSINRIAAEAELAPMSVYRYFGSKDKLIAEVWHDALVIFYDDFMRRYHDITADMDAGYDRFIACMDLSPYTANFPSGSDTPARCFLIPRPSAYPTVRIWSTYSGGILTRRSQSLCSRRLTTEWPTVR